MKRCRYLFVLFTCVIGASLFVQSASASQGVRWRLYGLTDNGTRANVRGTGANNSTGGVFAAVGIQNDTPTPGSPVSRMLQIAEIKETANSGTDCASVSGYQGLAVERQVSVNDFICDVHGGYTFGANYRLAVVQANGGGWYAYVDGLPLEGPWALGMSGGFSIARGEAYWSSTSPSFNFTWGPSGYTPWQFTANHGSSYTTISQSVSGQDGGWHLEGTPSPFRIYR